MKILFLDAYFAPEVTSFSHLENDFIQALVNSNHSVNVVCPTPTRGVDAETIKRYKKVDRELLWNGKVEVRRFWAPQEGKNPITRAIRYFWCNSREYGVVSKYQDTDAIFVASTPPTQGMLGGKVAKKLSKRYKKKVPFIYNLQDVFPDSLVTTGLTKRGSLIWKIGRKIENYTYNAADHIIVISESMKRNIMEKGVSEDKITVISNWIDVEETKPVDKADNRLYEEFGISRDKFTVLYAGNFGKAQGADVVLRAAESLKDNDRIQFVIFGGGSGFEAAKNAVAEKKLDNVIINKLLPQERVPEVYSLGDVALITCKKGVGNSGMPSKTWSIMACDTPIIASFDTDSELAEILSASGAGVCVEPEDEGALVAAILSAKDKTLNVKGGRDYVCKNASKNVCVPKYVEILKESVK